MGILAWIVVGVIAGFLAKVVVPDDGSKGLLGDLIVGVMGALVGGWIMRAFGNAEATGIHLWSIFVAFVGALVLLYVLRIFTSRRPTN